MAIENGEGFLAERLREHRGLFPGEKLRYWLEERVVEKLGKFKGYFKTEEGVKKATFTYQTSFPSPWLWHRCTSLL